MSSKKGAIIIEGHVQGLSNTRSLGEAGVPVYVVDKNNCIARYSKYCSKFFFCPEFNEEAFADFLVDLAQKEHIRGWVLIPSNDHAVYTISKNKRRLEEHYKVITPDIGVIEKIYDKSKLLEIAYALGVPIPKRYCIEDGITNIEEIVFPVLTKGRQGLDFYRATGQKAFLSSTKEELAEQLKEIQHKFPIQKTLTQKVIPFDGTNKTVSFTAFCVDGEIKTFWMGEKLREHPIQFGTATLARSIYIEECYKQSIPLLKELKYTGVCEVEYLKDPDDQKYKLIEINARTWLWVGLAKACGVDYAMMIYNYVNGKHIFFPIRYDINLFWINRITDIPYSIISLLKRRLKFHVWLKSFFTIKTDASFSKNDIIPYLMYFILAFQFIRKR